MRYYEKPVNRSDKDGERMPHHYDTKDEELDKAKQSGNNGVRTDAFAEGDGYLGVDDLDRLRRDKLRHQTR